MAEVEQAEKLELALLERAEALAKEQISHARDERERQLQQVRERLQQRQQQQHQQLLELGERHFRQQLQAAELRMQSRLEHLRWTLIESVLGEVDSRLEELCHDEGRYGEILQAWLEQAASALGGGEDLVLQLNQRDLQRFGERFSGNYHLSDEPLNDRGGLVLYSADGRARFNNSFAGRRERLQTSLFRIVNERLFGTGIRPGEQHGR
jgi:V/A-type H+-transporting ATPase subunit E